MLINYEFSNFRSFKDKAVLSMKASSQTTFNDNLIRQNGLRILPSAVIYGANASGKSNIIKSLQFLQSIIMIGNLSSSSLKEFEFCPFLHSKDNSPIYFNIDFSNEGQRFNYELKISGEKVKRDNRHIEYESLSIIKNSGNKFILFERNENSVLLSTDKMALQQMKINKKFVSSIKDRLNANLDKNILFLTGGFKNIISSETADIVTRFFLKNLIILNDFTAHASISGDGSNNVHNRYKIWNDLLDSFVKAADFGPQNVFFVYDEDNDKNANKIELTSEYEIDGKKILVPAELMESRGTIKLIYVTMMLQAIFNSGGVLIVDELDTSLHSEIVKGLISIYNDSKVNSSGSQLIFTTHNPVYLDNKIFRRDQIFIINKDKFSYRSNICTLADFGSVSVRNDENYMINYLKGKYSSMPYIDFSSLIANNIKADFKMKGVKGGQHEEKENKT